MSSVGTQPGQLGGLEQAPLGQGDAVVDEVPVARPDEPDVRLEDDHATARREGAAERRAAAR